MLYSYLVFISYFNTVFKLTSMKYLTGIIIPFILISGFTGNRFSDTQIGFTDSTFIVFYTPGSAWNFSKPPQEQLHFASHSKMLSSLRKEGKIKIGGRYSDKGLLLIQSPSFQEAKNIIYSDSAVITKLFAVELYPFSAFYKGCID